MSDLPDSLLLAVSVLSAAIVFASAVVALALAHLSRTLARTLRTTADDALHSRSGWIRVGDDNWRAIVSQIATDTLGEPVQVSAFAGMTAGEGQAGAGTGVGVLRFVIRDTRRNMRVLTFVAGADPQTGHPLDARAAGELGTVWRYFTHHTRASHTAPIPRQAMWYVTLTPKTESPAVRHQHRSLLPRWRTR